jgi:hypothetical protein
MLTITFHNDGTGSKGIANYDVTVRVNEHVIERLRVEGHERALGWRALAARLLEPPGDVCYCGKPCDNLAPCECTTSNPS